MKKILTIAAALALAASLSLPAMPAMAAGPERVKAQHSRFTPEQRAEYKKVKAEYLNETLALRQQLAAKKVELKTLLRQPSPDAAKIKTVADEKVDLWSQVMKKRNEYLAKYPQYFGHDRRHDKRHDKARGHQDRRMKGQKVITDQPS
ncbi:MAG: periplasmic heavy metal sensor [Pseudomonadota bacterium]